MQILANEKAAQINIFLESQKEKQLILASMNVFEEAVKYPNDTAKIELAKDRINELKVFYPGIGVLSKEGIIVVSENNPAGTDYSAMPQFPISNKSILTFIRYYDIQRKKDYYGVFAPFYEGIEKNEPIGVIGFDIELDKLNFLMKEVGNSKENLEVYFIDDTGLLLSDSKYIGKDNKHGILIQEIKSEGAEDCLEDLKKYQKNGRIEEHEGRIIKYKNYMGDEVYGVHAHVPTIMSCVIAEKSADEIESVSFIKILISFLKGDKK